ncbi:hypothetical protein [Pseudomonas sp. NFACC25]|uniref:hypothetical protein n=1 Tax=Pseudomonas sp. NFACC25 TaxID=1566188 RepID=UPI001113B939|nr:hypothetical protein [Pseudomonas sp. NFACC25]
MTGFMKVSDKNGVFDFTANMIEIKKYNASARKLIERAISGVFEEIEQPESKVLRTMKSLVVHEYVHFLDLTTTLWGMEYIARKNLLAKAIADDGEIHTRKDVSLINVSELHAHEQLVRTSGVGLLKTTLMNHEVVIDERFGPIIFIYYNVEEEIIQSVPLSMMAVLEANAYACEILSRIYDAERLVDPVARAIALQEAEDDFEGVLDDPGQSVYTVLISLAKLHFPLLDTKQLMLLMNALVKFTLDLNSFEMSEMANYVQRSIESKYAGEVISDDMRRGASRAVVAFKTILIMHGWRNAISSHARSHHDQLLKQNPQLAIEHCWSSIGMTTLSKELTDYEFDVQYKNMYSLCLLEEEFKLYAESKFNRAALSFGNMASVGFDKLKLMDFFLEDGSVACPPNRIDIDVEEYLLNYASISVDIDKLCRGDSATKFYRLPNDPIIYSSPFDHTD